MNKIKSQSGKMAGEGIHPFVLRCPVWQAPVEETKEVVREFQGTLIVSVPLPVNLRLHKLASTFRNSDVTGCTRLIKPGQELSTSLLKRATQVIPRHRRAPTSHRHIVGQLVRNASSPPTRD